MSLRKFTGPIKFVATAPLQLEKYTKKEIEQLTGLSQSEFFDLLRKRPDRGGDKTSIQPFFIPSFYAADKIDKKTFGRGYTADLSFSDLFLLSILKILKVNRLDKSIGRFLWQIFGDDSSWWMVYQPDEIVIRQDFKHREDAPRFFMELLFDQSGKLLARVGQEKAGERSKVQPGTSRILISTSEGLRSAMDQPSTREIEELEKGALGKIELDLNQINFQLNERLKLIGRG